MNRHVRIFLAGAVLVIPLVVTIGAILWVGSRLDELASVVVKPFWQEEVSYGLGAVAVIAAIYLIGLLTHVWVFRGLFGWLERLLTSLPGVRTIYESVRDLLRLFGGEAAARGRAVQYRPPGTDVALLGILTNERPAGFPHEGPDRRVAVYLPLAYMIGGPTIYVSPEHIRDVDLSVEQVLKLAATAQVTSVPMPRGQARRAETAPKPDTPN